MQKYFILLTWINVVFFRVNVKNENVHEGVISELQLASTESSDGATYICQAVNKYGRTQQHIQLMVQGADLTVVIYLLTIRII